MNIDIKDTWFTTDLEKNPSETPSHEPSVAPKNNNKILTPLQYEPHIQERQAIKGEYVSEVIKHPDSEGVQHTLNSKKVRFYQQSSNAPSRMPSHKG